MGTISIDCVSVKPVRMLNVYSDKIYYEWRGEPDSLREYSSDEKKMKPVLLYDNIERNESYDKFILENPYIEEIKEFFSIINTKSIIPCYGYEEDFEILKLISSIEGDD